MKKTILAMMLAATVFTSNAFAAPSAHELKLAKSIHEKFKSVAKYGIWPEHDQLEGRVVILFENGGYKIAQSSGNEILDANAEEVARDTLKKMNNEEKQLSVTIPLNYVLIVPNTWCMGGTCPHYSEEERRKTREVMGDKYYF